MARYKTFRDYDNRNAIIRNRETALGKLRTETARRDSGLQASITTDPTTNATKLSVTTDQGLIVRFDGREARTLFRLMSKHFDYANKSLDLLF